MLICGVIASSTAQKALASRPLLYLGKISHSIYLVHIFVLKSITPPLLRFFNDRVTNVDSMSVIFFVSTIGIVIVLSDILYRVVELPSMQIGGWLSSKINRGHSIGG